MTDMLNYTPRHFKAAAEGDVAVLSLDRPDRKNPLTFDSYGELRDYFQALKYADDVKAVVFTSNGGNFSSGGDVHEIIGPLLDMDMKRLLEFTRMTGDLVKAMIGCGKPIIAAIDGICVGAGAIIVHYCPGLLLHCDRFLWGCIDWITRWTRGCSCRFANRACEPVPAWSSRTIRSDCSLSNWRIRRDLPDPRVSLDADSDA